MAFEHADPTSTLIELRRKGRNLLDIGEYEAAARVLKDAVESSLGKMEHCELSLDCAWIVYDCLGDIEGARALAEGVLQTLAGDEEALPNVALLRGSCHCLLAYCLSSGTPDTTDHANAAIAVLKITPISEREDALAYRRWLLARAYARLRQFDDAIALLEEYASMELDDREYGCTLVNLSLMLRYANRVTDAAKMIGKAQSVGLKDPMAVAAMYTELGEIHLELSAFSDAVIAFRNAIAAFNNLSLSACVQRLVGVRVSLVECLLALGNRDVAIIEVALARKDLADFGDASTQAHFLIALGDRFMERMLYDESRDLYSAVASVSGATVEQKSHARASQMMAEGSQMFQSGLYADANARFLQVLAMDPLMPNLSRDAALLVTESDAILLFDASKYSEALKQYELILGYDFVQGESRAAALLMSGLCNLHLRRFHDAKRLLERVLHEPGAADDQKVTAADYLEAIPTGLRRWIT